MNMETRLHAIEEYLKIIRTQLNQGEDATVSVDVGTTTTGEAGTNASVVNSGDNRHAIFDFTIPRGERGLQGERGEKGDKGDKGDGIVDCGITETSTYTWIWKKWSNGVLELDLFWEFTKAHYTTFGSFYAYFAIISWGSDLGLYFVNTDYSLTQSWVIGGGYAIPATVLDKSTGQCTCYGLGSQSGTRDCTLSAHIVGQWK